MFRKESGEGRGREKQREREAGQPNVEGLAASRKNEMVNSMANNMGVGGGGEKEEMGSIAMKDQQAGKKNGMKNGMENNMHVVIPKGVVPHFFLQLNALFQRSLWARVLFLERQRNIRVTSRYSYIYIYMYAYICMHIYVHICHIYIYIHTYPYTYIKCVHA
jgi:hypothetical protein